MSRLLLLLLFISLIFSNQKEWGYIQDFSGEVEIISSDEKRVILPAISGRSISNGDIVKVYANSFCDIVSQDKRTFARIDEKSEAKFVSSLLETTTEIYLKNGSLYSHHTNNHTNKKTFLFLNHSQIYLTNSKVWITIDDKEIDKIYSFGDEINISDKYKGIRQSSNEVNMFFSNSDDIQLIESEDPTMDFRYIVPDYVFTEFMRKGVGYTLHDSLLFSVEQTDLIPRYYANVDTYNLESTNNGFSISSGGSYYYDGSYFSIGISPYFKRGNLELIFQINEFISLGDPYLKINDWSNLGTFLSKLSYLSYFNSNKNIYLNAGKLKNLTFGHGQLLHNYSNSYNYPIMQRTGIQLHISPLNKKSYLIDFFISDIYQIFQGGGFLGIHGSLFLSNFFPMNIGYGYLTDLDQYSEQSILNSENSRVNAHELDFEYTILNNLSQKWSLFSEFDAIIFPYEVKYYRDEEEDASLLNRRKLTWGSIFGGKVSLQSGHKFLFGLHNNSALYTPYYFSSTYDFEKVRTLQYDKNNTAHFINRDFLICDEMNEGGECDDGATLYLSKDIYYLISRKDFVYPTIGASFQYNYDYYNKRGIKLSGMYLYDSVDSSSDSYYLLDVEVFSSGQFLFEGLNNFKFYFHRNFANSVSNENFNENIMIGSQFDFKVSDLLKLYINFQNVYYDINQDLITDKISSYSFEFKYNIKI